MSYGTVLGVLAPGATPHTTKVCSPGHAKTAVRVTLVAANKPTFVECDVGPVNHIVAVPDN